MRCVVCGCLLIWLLAGCASPRVYQASQLPAEFAAPPLPDLREINLPRLAAAGSPSDLVMPGDVLEVTISTDLEGNVVPVACRVDDQGFISLPQLGPIAVGGLRFPEVESRIAQTAIAKDVYRRPYVTVARKSTRTYRVTVAGAVAQPGVYELPAAQADVLAALVQAGGLTVRAEPVVEIRYAGDLGGNRLQPDSLDGTQEGRLTAWSAETAGDADGSMPANTVRIDLISMTQEKTTDAICRLHDGDVVYVPELKRDPIYVDGLVTRPGMYELPRTGEICLLDALALAGGRSNPLAEKVMILRRVPAHTEPVVIKANLRTARKIGAENVRIAPGDIILVEDTFSTFIYDLMKGFVHIGGSIPLE